MIKKLLQFFILIFLFVAAMTAGRLYFFLKYLAAYSGLNASSIAASFLQGLRFDLSTASIVALPILLLLFLPGVTRSRGSVRALLGITLLWYLLLIGYNFIDIQYYAFTQRHLTFEINNTWRDTDVVMKIALRKYSLEFIGFLVFAALFSVVFRRLTAPLRELPDERDKGFIWVLKDSVALFIVFAVLFVFIRAGFQTKPLSIQNAFANEKTELGVLTLNGVYTTFNTLFNARDDKRLAARLKSLKPASEIDIEGVIVSKEREENTPGYPLFRRFRHKEPERRRLNVVIFVMESWSA
ncbi:MAG: hypothetical protein HZB83_07795, partial [Deltaproteobacteria bacterium]|nr:hypothetical protein [Deltaproteobacteria bacterium]